MAHENTVLIKQLNRIPFIGLKGIKVGDALSIDTWHFQEWTKEKISTFEFMTIPEYNYRVEGESVDKAFIFSYAHIKRADQLNKFHAVESIFDNKAVIVAQKGKLLRNRYLALIPFWYSQMRGLDYSPIIKRGICYKICEALGHADMIMRLIKRTPEVRKLIFFFDVLSIDNILVQMCNQRNYTTYTMQHGIISGIHDYVEYRCTHADYLLAWGEYTKWVALKYGIQESKIKVVGSMSRLNEGKDFVTHGNKYNCFLVCTNGVADQSSWNRNKEIIIMANQIAEKYHIKYYLKVHPYDNVNRYRHITKKQFCERIVGQSEKIEDMLKIVDFTLCGNSTTFCDSIYHMVPAFRYIPAKDKKIDVCKGIRFGRIESCEELEKYLDRLNTRFTEYEKKMYDVKKFIFDTGDVVQKYKHVITEIN